MPSPHLRSPVCSHVQGMKDCAAKHSALSDGLDRAATLPPGWFWTALPGDVSVTQDEYMTYGAGWFESKDAFEQALSALLMFARALRAIEPTPDSSATPTMPCHDVAVQHAPFDRGFAKPAQDVPVEPLR